MSRSNRNAITVLLATLVHVSTGWTAAAYELGEDSKRQDGVPEGTITKHTFESSSIYPDASHDYWVYVPAQYKGDKPACVMVFQDGQAYVHEQAGVAAPVVFDNLIHKGEMPVTIGIFVNPGRKDTAYELREQQYVPVNDSYARFLLEEIIPEVDKEYNLVDDASGRAICGMSDGGLVSFTVGWHRPDAFSKIVSHIGSYTRLRGGSEYPYLIRQTRDNPKPIRVFLQDGDADLNLLQGNWTLANLEMESALMFARYDYRFEMGSGGHDLQHGGAIFPDTMRWIWRDYPGVKGADNGPDLDAVAGTWEVETNSMGNISNSTLDIAIKDGALTAKLTDEKHGELKVKSIRYEDGILQYAYVQRASLWGKEAEDLDYEKDSEDTKDGKGSKKSKDAKASKNEKDANAEKDSKWTKESKSGRGDMTTWLKVDGDTFKGALSMEQGEAFDLPIRGQRTSGSN